MMMRDGREEKREEWKGKLGEEEESQELIVGSD